MEKKNLPGRGLTTVEKHCSKGEGWEITWSKSHNFNIFAVVYPDDGVDI
jgi:hypothetical protein